MKNKCILYKHGLLIKLKLLEITIHESIITQNLLIWCPKCSIYWKTGFVCQKGCLSRYGVQTPKQPCG